jgi:acyl carrier protein
MSVTAELEAFIVDEIALGVDVQSLAPDENLLSRGIVDSLGVTVLVTFVEERFGIEIGDEDLTPANFQSLARIEAFIARKRLAEARA